MESILQEIVNIYKNNSNTGRKSLWESKFKLDNGLIEDGNVITVDKEGIITAENIEEFMQCDPISIKEAIEIYWYIITNTKHKGKPENEQTKSLLLIRKRPIHLIYAYMIENTRIAQIFERIIYNYQHNELFGIPDPKTRQWIDNTEYLFYGNNILNSSLRTNFEAVRRNAYYRMFGMDLTFGDSSSNTSKTFPYHKSEVANTQFVATFEKLLKEIWQGYINDSNQVGIKSTDEWAIKDLLNSLYNMMLSRRTKEEDAGWDKYATFNLSKEEFYAVVMMEWLYFTVRKPLSIVNDLSANAAITSERLINLGKRVGLSAHSKSSDLLNLAFPMSKLLKVIEDKDLFSSRNSIDDLISRNGQLNETALQIINLWERTTGHRIKEKV
jgi:hypothetical protein